MESSQLEKIVDFLCNDLGGDWLLAGGSLVRLVFDANRGTEDVDLMRIQHASLSDEAAKDRLFRYVMGMGLGPEHVNSAVEPFVRRVTGWENEVRLIREGCKGRIYRPSVTLFVYLKLSRGTMIDREDIRTVLKARTDDLFDEAKFLSWADEKLQSRYVKSKKELGV